MFAISGAKIIVTLTRAISSDIDCSELVQNLDCATCRPKSNKLHLILGKKCAVPKSKWLP